MTRIKQAIDWLFRDRRTGRITIAQVPNASFGVFLVALLVQNLADANSSLGRGADYAASAALAWWAVDELARGVNPWRRLLGAGGVVYAVVRFVGSV